MKTDSQIQTDVMEELKSQPSFHPPEIGVAVKNGLLTLLWTVESCPKKNNVKNAAKRNSGVEALMENIRIGVSPGFAKTDTEIAEAVFNASTWHSALTQEQVKSKVGNGIVTLEGQLNWGYQRVNAKASIQILLAACMVVNLHKVKPKAEAFRLGQQIAAAFRRNAVVDASRVSINVSGNNIVLIGHIRSVAEREDAGSVAGGGNRYSSSGNRPIIESPQLVN